jgi:hypothetical protein
LYHELIDSHKSYHPYNEKNKARVREDEARAAEAELAKEQKRVEKVCPSSPFS